MDKIKFSQFEFEEVSNKGKYKSAVESLLFVCGEPISLKEISRILDISEGQTEIVIELLKEDYNNRDRGIKLISLNNCYQLVTKPENSDYIQKLLKKNVRQTLSQASLESLAIIAYRQPVTRIEIDEIRGVKSESAVQKLIERNLIKEVGRLDVPGRPKQFATTDEFLRQFNLHDIKQLPALNLFEDAANDDVSDETAADKEKEE